LQTRDRFIDKYYSAICKQRKEKIMVYKKRDSHQVSEIIPDEQAELEMGAQNYAYGAKSGRGFLKFVIIALVVIVVVVGGWYLIDNYTDWNLPGMNFQNKAVSRGWYAVFLSNGQVYFGKIDKINKSDLVLSNIYYLQVVTKPLQQSQETPSVNQAQTQQELTLAKLGNELHGPVDIMTINRDHILLTEELKEDSKVVTAITTYIAEQAAK